MSYTVVLPTYNEARNLVVLLPMVKRHIGAGDDVLVVDDGNDSTPHICDIERVAYLRGPGLGLTAAIRFAIASVKQQGIVVMDADLQHDPKYIPALTAGIPNGMLTIGSRYIEGGSWREEGWREVMSLLACSLSYPLLTNVKDNTSGFFAMPTKAFCFSAINLYAPKVLLEILVKCPPKKVREIPITFGTRAFGESRYMGYATVAKYARQVAGLYIWRYTRQKAGSREQAHE